MDAVFYYIQLKQYICLHTPIILMQIVSKCYLHSESRKPQIYKLKKPRYPIMSNKLPPVCLTKIYFFSSQHKTSLYQKRKDNEHMNIKQYPLSDHKCKNYDYY